MEGFVWLVIMDLKYPYPKHLYDPLRKKIAARYIQHELRKLFPSVTQSGQWDKIDADVEMWFSENATLTPVRGFWNNFYAVCRGMRYKNLLPILTSQNVEWREETVKFSDLHFGAIFEGMKFLHKRLSILEAREVLSKPEHKQDKARLLQILKSRSVDGVPRDKDSVIINEKEKSLEVIDGNRRVFIKAMVDGEEKITAFVGRPVAEPEIFEQWVPIGFLKDLLYLHSQARDADPNLNQNIAHIIAEALKNSTSGQLEWYAVCYVSDNPSNKLLQEMVAKILENF